MRCQYCWLQAMQCMADKPLPRGAAMCCPVCSILNLRKALQVHGVAAADGCCCRCTTNVQATRNACPAGLAVTRALAAHMSACPGKPQPLRAAHCTVQHVVQHPAAGGQDGVATLLPVAAQSCTSLMPLVCTIIVQPYQILCAAARGHSMRALRGRHSKMCNGQHRRLQLNQH